MSNSTFNWEDATSVGQVIGGLKMDENRFVAVMKFARLERLVTDPAVATNPKLRGVSSAHEDEYRRLHDEMQRAFDTGRKKNVEDYANYIVGVASGQFGDTPSIDFYTPVTLHVREGSSKEKAEIVWPYDLTCVPYDGETQLAARFAAVKKDLQTREQTVIVTITHGRPVAHAKQCFHDRNALQRRASTSLAMKMNTRDPLMNIVRDLESNIPGLDGMLEWEGRQARAGKIVTASGLRTAVACFAYGISGVQLTKTEDLPNGISEFQFGRRANLWFGKILPRLLPYMADRDKYVAGAPAVLAALGAMGHTLLNEKIDEGHSLDAMASGLAEKLRDISWEKSDSWIGLAVKATPTGYSFAGGAKDSGSACFKALTDKEDANFSRVRVPVRKAA